MYYIILAGAVLIDLIIGDPVFIPHPVVLIGKVISFLENLFRNIIKENNKILLISAGIIIVIITTAVTGIFTYMLIAFGYKLNFYLGFIIQLWLASTVLAVKGLKNAGLKVYNALKDNDLDQARKEVGMIVGRDTEMMGKEDIIRAVIETIAENTSDGIIAPVFYYMIGGVPLAMIYKAINTLDSMLGYKNEKYFYLGRAAARLDDIANFIPARITGISMGMAALITGNKGITSFKTMLRDAGKHPSWNAGYPEAAAAGALGIRLGGLNYYQGEAEFRSYMGKKLKNIQTEDIKQMLNLMYWCTFIVILVMFMFSLFIA